MSHTTFPETSFAELDLITPILEALRTEGYETPTEIQARAIPVLLTGQDLLGTSQTGGGKTAAFVLPMLQALSVAQQKERVFEEPPAAHRPSNGKNLDKRRSGKGGSRFQSPLDRLPGRPGRIVQAPARPSALILAPTRELAVQISESVRAYGARLKIRHTVVYGGASKVGQERELGRQPEVLVATPGRLLDFINEKKIILEEVRYLVLDEADRMLDMGFIPDVRRIVAMTAKNRQTAMFSATMPREIADLAAGILTDPVRVQCESGSMTVVAIDQSVMFVNQDDKLDLLVNLIEKHQMYKALVFTRTKHRASRIAKALGKLNIESDAIHGDKTQSARMRAMDRFRKGEIQVLVATDVAARGIDVDSVTHVINFEMPAEAEAETYVHRIGRTGRAGAVGAAVSFCSRDEVRSLRAIEKLTNTTVRVERDHAYHIEIPTSAPRSKGFGNRRNGGSGGSGGNGGNSNGNGSGGRGGQRSRFGGFSKPSGGGNPRSRGR